MAETGVAAGGAAEAAIDALPRQRAIIFIVFLGVVSLFGDMTYEGARSVTGPYLGMLGVTATTIGIVSGFGELMGYGARLANYQQLLFGRSLSDVDVLSAGLPDLLADSFAAALPVMRLLGSLSA